MAERLVAVIDKGGRGAAFIDAYAKNPNVGGVITFSDKNLASYLTDKRIIPYPLTAINDVDSIVRICVNHNVVLADVSQDAAVAAGVANALRAEGISTVGHSKEASVIEADKAWCRLFLQKIGLDEYQPKFKVCQSLMDGVDFVEGEKDQKWFVKAAGLAEGKGAVGAKNKFAVKDIIIQLKRTFPETAKQYLIEEWMLNDNGTQGEEFSFFALCKGRNWKFEGVARDHKTVFEYGEGDNTGGMGCNVPVSHFTQEISDQVKEITDKVVNGMADEFDENGNSRELSGDLYLGGMIVTENGKQRVKIVEFNARFGDPEAQAILPGITTDRYRAGRAVAGLEDFSTLDLQTDGLARLVLAGVSKGYPGKYEDIRGKRIFGLREVLEEKNVKVYGAGVKEMNGDFFADGGRLFYLVGEGQNIVEARKKAYEAMAGIFIDGFNLRYRKDIGEKEVARFWETTSKN